ncbi:fungal specific transcription factor domain-containing protein [Aspergillus clavatus NRRL 1]|uniref:Uncharacterized protein n=1 Tax=Aspergillus clavatus (strain ATCC 1007 / CBS 513.65 / DSM 816 / NCTC 3887 / NRRL 1 / QM 1276 / 107) TaxID=344612 RepID=A1CCK2_ASPCL|nr:uncharacterized protein ACLA_062220 [Aspergillus clavatus NRRL 1]EAW12259.1 conserved hypothetical protein [Aspergillus clavatus NRRL 1]
MDRGLPADLGHLALLFSIVASSVYFKFSPHCSAYAERCSHEFGYLAGAALIQSNYTACPTLEGLQATIIIIHNLPNSNAHPSTNALFMHGAIVGQARSLMLHCIDSPRCREEREVNGFDAVEVELKRRLWWDVASLDWLLGFLSGPQEWTYLVNPEMMNVQEPLNIDDINLQEAAGMSSPAMSTPTEMSYTLQRLKLAVVCREITDATTYEHMHSVDVSYHKILDLDRKLHQAYNELTDFFRLDSVSRRRFASLYQSRPTIAWQRCLLHQAYHSRFCRLHRLYFIRGARDPAYSYSHVICLQSARKVIETKRIMDEDDPKFMPPTSVVWSVMHHVFMAAVILLMDVCFNWDDLLADKRKQEVLDACRMLSKAQQSSSMVTQAIKAMMDILQKHWKTGKQLSSDEQSIGLSSPPGLEDMTSANPAPPERPEESTESNGLKNHLENSPFDFGDDARPERHLEDVWTEMLDSGGDLSFHTPDWTGLLAELTNATLPYT